MLMPAFTSSQAAAAAAAAVAAAGNPSTGNNLSETVLHQKDTTWTKLFVGGLPYHTTDTSLREHFKIYGDIDEAVVITDRQTGKSRGYGFVIMSDRLSAERACKEPNPIIDGRKANVNLAILGAKPRGNAAAAAAAAAAASFPFTAVRTGYPTSLLASNYGLPTVYQPGGAAAAAAAAAYHQQAMLPANSLATALATQFYDYQPMSLTTASASPFTQAHFAAAQAAAFDPYANYIAAAQAQGQQQAAAAAYAYSTGGGGNSGTGGVGVINPYAQQDSRIQ